LTLNPNDHQGVRYTLMSLFLRLHREHEGLELLEQFMDDSSTEWLYSRALLTFRLEGNSLKANRALGNALSYNKYVPGYLTGRESMPEEMPSSVIEGDDSDAVFYVSEHYPHWWGTNGAIDWLKSLSELKASKKRSSKSKRKRKKA
jgi:hypothetical protein